MASILPKVEEEDDYNQEDTEENDYENQNNALVIKAGPDENRIDKNVRNIWKRLKGSRYGTLGWLVLRAMKDVSSSIDSAVKGSQWANVIILIRINHLSIVLYESYIWSPWN